MSLPDNGADTVDLSLRTRVDAAEDPDEYIQSVLDETNNGERGRLISAIRQRGVDFVMGSLLSVLTRNKRAFKRDSNNTTFVALGEAILNQNTNLVPFLRTDGSLIPISEDKNILHWAAGANCPHLVSQILRIIDQQHNSLDDRHRAVSAKSGDDQTALVYAIRKADLETCQVLINYDRRLLEKTFSTIADTPLHTAIKLFLNRQEEWGNCHEIVTLIVKSDPGILCRANRTSAQGTADSPPYRLAMDIVGNQAPQQELERLRTGLKELLFRYLRHDVEALAEALYKKNDKRKLLELDLSDFDVLGPTAQRGDFARFVKTFCNPIPMDGIEFEQTLASVSLPDMSMALNQNFDNEIVVLFRALNEIFKVQKIVCLTAWDNPFHPLPDSTIALIVDAFKVEELRWYKSDLDIDVLRPRAASLRKISLFSSGNWGTLYHWTSLSGVLSFPKLKEVSVTIVEGPPLNKCLELQKRVNERFGPRTVAFEVSINRPHQPESAIVTREDKSSSDRFFGVFSSVHPFLEGKQLSVQRPLVGPRIKIAIIDNGFDKWQTTISENIKEGISYASRAGRTLPWFTASHAHGTNMAFLIRKLNPVCEFFVYRVNSLRGDIDATKAIKAIDAASEANVDIINISWTFDKNQNGLEDAINRAARTTQDKAGALIFCATSDEPYNTEPVYPADYDSTISVSAATGRGRRRAESRKNVDLMVLGENVLADGPSYFTAPQKLVSGSSVATALASGIASVLLVYAMCARRDEGDWKEFKRKEKMMKLFKHMQPPGDDDRYVDPSKLFLHRLQEKEDAWKHLFDLRYM